MKRRLKEGAVPEDEVRRGEGDPQDTPRVTLRSLFLYFSISLATRTNSSFCSVTLANVFTDELIMKTEEEREDGWKRNAARMHWTHLRALVFLLHSLWWKNRFHEVRFLRLSSGLLLFTWFSIRVFTHSTSCLGENDTKVWEDDVSYPLPRTFLKIILFRPRGPCTVLHPVNPWGTFHTY